MENQIPLTIIDLFKFIGTPVFVGFIVSFLLERVAWFQQLGKDAKAIVALGFAVGFALLSYALTNYVPQALIDALQPWYAAAVTGVIGFIASQVWHRIFNVPTVTIEAEAIEESDDYDDDF
jgi:putative flippase GtrA